MAQLLERAEWYICRDLRHAWGFAPLKVDRRTGYSVRLLHCLHGCDVMRRDTFNAATYKRIGKPKLIYPPGYLQKGIGKRLKPEQYRREMYATAAIRKEAINEAPRRARRSAMRSVS